MAAEIAGENFFSDDDLDALPDDALDELEQNAIQLTQYHRTQATVILDDSSSSKYGEALEGDDVENAIVKDQPSQILARRIPAVQGLSTRTTTTSEQFQPSRYGYGSGFNPSGPRQLQQPGRRPVFHRNDSDVTLQSETGAAPGVATPHPPQAAPVADVETLQRQVQELLQERENLKLDLSTKVGEISIVRSKQEKAAKEYERELAFLKKSNAEKLAKHQRDIELAKKAEKSAADDLEFVKRDLAEEAARARNLAKTKEKTKGGRDEPATPRKDKNMPYRDGFDDDEIQVISPSKFVSRKSNPSTPTKAGTKRKRTEPDSPAVPLQIEEHHTPKVERVKDSGVVDGQLLERMRLQDDRLTFLEMALDHRPQRDQLRTTEEFARVYFPSNPQESFASIIYGKLPTLSKQSAAEFPVQLCELLITLWKQCLTENYFQPLWLIIDLLTFCLQLRTMSIAPFIIDTLITVAQRTAEPKGLRLIYREAAADCDQYIDISACLSLIHLTALGCINHKERTQHLWRQMNLQFVLIMLSPNAKAEDFDSMLQLLAISVMNDSVGPIAQDSELQLNNARYILDRVSYILPNSQGMQHHSQSVLRALRLQALRTLHAFCQSSWGGEQIAVHRLTIGRLVKLMSSELETLYDHRSDCKQRYTTITAPALIMLTQK